jgi:hypothetical protein
MPITFDSLEELKDFYRTFRLEEKAGAGRLSTVVKETPTEKRKPGRPPKADKTEKKAPQPATKKPGVKGRPAKSAVVAAPKAKTAKAVSAKASATGEKRPKGRPKAEGTLTSKIQDTIQKFVNAKKEFTANDIYDDLSKREKDVNKQSVITSVLKQMNSQFANISVSERPGAGPRPVKVYRP